MANGMFKWLNLLFLPLWLPAATPPSPLGTLAYDITLRVDLGHKRLKGTEKITFRTAQEVSSLTFDAEEMEIRDVETAPPLAGWSHEKGKFTVRFKSKLSAEQDGHVLLRYQARPRVGVTFRSRGVQACFDTAHWMVCDMSPASVATLNLDLVLPKGMRAAASGQYAGSGLESGLWHSLWRQEKPVPPFVFGFAAGSFQEAVQQAGPLKLHFMSGRHTIPQLARMFAETTEAVRFFQEKAGFELEPGTYTQVLTPENDMQEMAQMTVLPEAYGDHLLQDPTNIALLVHELSHQWWGVRIPCADWTDFWLNEGMANFITDAYIEHRFGEKAYEKAVEVHEQLYSKAKAARKDRPLCYSGWSTPVEASGVIPYHKGAYVLHLLRKAMGEAPFWKGLRDYSLAHRDRPATSQDLKHDLEKSSGQDLKAFFDQWVYN